MQLQRKSMLSAAKLTVLTLLMLPLLTLQAAGAYVQETSVVKSGTLERYAGDTWESFQAMVFSETGLPTDNINADTNERDLRRIDDGDPRWSSHSSWLGHRASSVSVQSTLLDAPPRLFWGVRKLEQRAMFG